MNYFNIPVNYKKLKEDAITPEQSHPGDLFDVYANSFKMFPNSISLNNGEQCLIRPGGWCLAKTGIAFDLPVLVTTEDGNTENWVTIDKIAELEKKWGKKIIIKAFAQLDVRPRSGLALKHGISIINSPGTIDNGYKDELGVIIQNLGVTDYRIVKGDRIAQISLRPQLQMDLKEVKTIGSSERGLGGFGSTGK